MKAVLNPDLFFTGDMSASFTVQAPNVLQIDVLAFQLNYSGSSPVGTIQVEVSLDGVNYVSLPVSINGAPAATTIAIPGATSPIYIDLFGVSYKFVQIVYTRTSGSGTMAGYVSYRRIGD